MSLSILQLISKTKLCVPLCPPSHKSKTVHTLPAAVAAAASRRERRNNNYGRARIKRSGTQQFGATVWLGGDYFAAGFKGNRNCQFALQSRRHIIIINSTVSAGDFKTARSRMGCCKTETISFNPTEYYCVFAPCFRVVFAPSRGHGL